MYSILLVDDDDVDVLALRKAFNKHEVMRKAKLHIAKNGKDAIGLLKNKFPIQPSLVVLDINMPGMGGLQFLDNIRSDIKLRNLRVLVLTTSANQNDIKAACSKCIVGYITKSKAGDYKALTELIYHYCSLTENIA